jgi:hypothetical protein
MPAQVGIHNRKGGDRARRPWLWILAFERMTAQS